MVRSCKSWQKGCKTDFSAPRQYINLGYRIILFLKIALEKSMKLICFYSLFIAKSYKIGYQIDYKNIILIDNF